MIRFLALSLILISAAYGQKAPRPAFAPVVDDPKLPRVLLIGDSISIGYTVAAREALEGIANVHRISHNAGDTAMGIKNLPKNLAPSKGTWDVIHFNWGLWDLCYRHPDSKAQGKRDKISGTVTHSVEAYETNLEQLVGELKKTGATLVFATTTPVPEAELGRKVGDDLRYNAAALAVMEKHGVAVNDLHAVMAERMDEFAVKPGDVHFTDEGSQLLAKQVAKSIQQALTKTQVLFDGSNLDAWEMTDPEGWQIDAEGSLTCRFKEVEKQGVLVKAPRGDLWLRTPNEDFVLTFDYRLSPGSNSGVFYRTDKTNKKGFEMQLMDNVGFQKRKGPKEDRKLNGSFYDCLAPDPLDAQNPIGEWTTARIACQGSRIRFHINGHLVIDVDVDDWNEVGKNPDGTTNKFKYSLASLPKIGFIGLQNHGDPVWFRNTRLRELGSVESGGGKAEGGN